jgi:hypothetical protein
VFEFGSAKNSEESNEKAKNREFLDLSLNSGVVNH